MQNRDNGAPGAVSRRRFLIQGGSAAAALALANAGRAAAASAPGDAKIILGSGSHKYEWVPDWLTPPSDLLWGDTQGVAQDSKGNIYISHTVDPKSPKGDAIAVFDKNGRCLTSWGERFRGGGHGLDLRREGREEYLYHCDTAHRLVVKTTLDGKVVWEKGTPVESGVYKNGNAYIPTNVAFGPNGDLYVADGYGSNYVHQYNLKGDYVRTFGGAGKEPGQLQQPHGIWVDTRYSEPLVAVADRANHRIQYFSLDGKHVRFANDGMRLPCHFSIRGDMLLVPDLSSVVTILDKDNKVITHLGDGAGMPELRGKPKSEFVPGKFIHPHSAKFLRNGDILVVEWVPQGRVTLLRQVNAPRESRPAGATAFPD